MREIGIARSPITQVVRGGLFHTSSSSCHTFTFEMGMNKAVATIPFKYGNVIDIYLYSFQRLSNSSDNGSNDPFVKASYLIQSCLGYKEVDLRFMPLPLDLTTESVAQRYNHIIQGIKSRTGAKEIHLSGYLGEEDYIPRDDWEEYLTAEEMYKRVYKQDWKYYYAYEGLIEASSLGRGLLIPEDKLMDVIFDNRYVLRDYGELDESKYPDVLYRNTPRAVNKVLA